MILSDPRLWDFCWLRDGRVIYAQAEPPPNETDANFWQIRVNTRTGDPAGKPRRVTNWAGFLLQNLTSTADGKRLAYLKQIFHNNVHVGELQANGTRLKDPPRRLTLGEYNDFPTAWTPDSQAVLFGSYRDGRYQILKQALNEESAEILATTVSYSYARLSPDGSWAVYSAAPSNAGSTTPVSLMRVPVSGGPPELVLTARGLTDYRCARAPATLCVLGEQSPDRPQLTIVSFDPIKGRGPELTKIETDPTGRYNWDLSPDASRLAVVRLGDSRIRVLPLGGDTAREVQIRGWGALKSVDWTADGRGFFAASQSPGRDTLLHIDLDGNAQVLRTQKGGFQTWGVPSPDGKRLAILGTTSESNVWMIESF